MAENDSSSKTDSPLKQEVAPSSEHHAQATATPAAQTTAEPSQVTQPSSSSQPSAPAEPTKPRFVET